MFRATSESKNTVPTYPELEHASINKLSESTHNFILAGDKFGIVPRVVFSCGLYLTQFACGKGPHA